MISLRKTLAATFAALLGLTGAVHAQEPLKVGFVYVGPVSDHGYSYQHDQGRLAIEKEFAGKVKTSFVENVPEGADAERVIRQLAQSGHKLIFTTSFGFMNPTLKVAQQFPDVKFEHATGYKRAKNVATYSARFYEGRTIAGTIAGMVSKTGTVGYIASFPIPEVVSGINAFTIALRKVRPDAQVKVIYVNSWYDPGKEAAAAKALMDQGADVLTQHTDSPAPVQAAAQRGLWSFGQSSDMSRFAPDFHATAIVDDWSGYYISRVKAVMDNKWEAVDTWGGLNSGMVVMSPYNPKLPKNVIEAAQKVEAELKSGAAHAFTGPIKDQAGAVRIPAGAKATDEQILSMNWYVEGVQGSLPK